MHSFNLQRVLLYDIELHDENAARQLAEMQITTLAPSRFMSRQPAQKRSVQFAYLRWGRREYKNIHWWRSHTKPFSTAAERGVYNSITVYLCPPPLHLNNCKIISVVCVFACHRSDTIFEFIYQSALFAFIELCALALLVHLYVSLRTRPACCECSSACSNFSHCCCWYIGTKDMQFIAFPFETESHLPVFMCAY